MSGKAELLFSFREEIYVQHQSLLIVSPEDYSTLGWTGCEENGEFDSELGDFGQLHDLSRPIFEAHGNSFYVVEDGDPGLPVHESEHGFVVTQGYTTDEIPEAASFTYDELLFVADLALRGDEVFLFDPLYSDPESECDRFPGSPLAFLRLRCRGRKLRCFTFGDHESMDGYFGTVFLW